MNRILAIDYGTKRIGVAISDPLGMTAQSLPFLTHDKKIFEQLRALTVEYDVSTIVLGLPRHMSGEESEKSREARAFGETLTDVLELPVDYWDERLSTVSAERHLVSAGVSRSKRKGKVDSLAASFILQGYLDKKRES